ncbi:MAG: uroporphyrinogen-III C-methyltransferase [FCB group bacterium]|jgi:uroporphyrinogen III methyltransferase/synthase|nr:uroporphyrinogen-III C-methyltransferase [FCB group bacterium]
MSRVQGKVYLVGAGPGDPGLLTLRGRECLEHADVVIYDYLANEALLEFCPPHAEKVFVGKTTDRHTLLQEEINRLLVEMSGRYSRVVRLKGGDPFVFGRGGEEALLLAQHGIPFEVVPGVTAGIAVPAYAGIPVTHRNVSAGVAFITAHGDPDSPQGIPDPLRTVTNGTLVLYMAVKGLARVAARLIELGRAPETPVAVIEWGTYPKQRTVVGTLANIVERCEAEKVQPPSITVVGDVVSLHDQISWFESRPLFGRRIVVTRAKAQASDLVKRLAALGADIFEFPTIQIAPPDEPEPFGYVGDYDWVIVTSVNGADMLFDRMEALGQDGRDLAGVKLCAIGTATAEAIRKRFLRVDLIPEKYVAEDLLDALVKAEGPLEGKRFLLPRADIARSFLPVELRKRGAEVKELVAYRTMRPESSNELADALVKYNPELITFTSSSTVQNFCEMVGPDRLHTLAQTTAFAAIGPITRKTAEDLGIPIAIEPPTHDIPSLVEAITNWPGR